MRFFEVVVLIADAYWLLNFFLNKHTRKEFAASFASGGILVLIIQLWREGFRWQMSFGYLLMIGFIFFSIQYILGKNRPQKRSKNKLQITYAVFAVVLLLLSALLSAYLFPIFNLPEQIGPYTVGSTSITLIDSSNFQNTEADLNFPKKLTIKIFYPSDINPYDNETGYQNYLSVFSGNISVPGIPNFLFGYLKYVKTHIIKDAGISKIKKNFPVIFFTPGISAHGFHKIYLIRNLVCQGYCVIAPDEMNSNNQAKMKTLNNNEMVQQKVYETEFILNQLSKINNEPGNKFYKKLDLNNSAAIGYSSGGAATIKALSEDKRFKAGIDLDGIIIPDKGNINLTQPLMFVFTNNTFIGKSNSPAKLQKEFENFYQRLQGDSYKLILLGASKYSFTDLPLYSPIFSSEIGTDRAHRIINDYVLSFFNKYLKDIGSNLLNAPSPDYYEIQFNKKSNRQEQFFRQSPNK